MAHTTPVPSYSKVIDHKYELSGLMKALLEESLNHDVTFRVEDRNFKAHRSILAIQSKVFRQMLIDETGKTTVVNLDDKRKAASFECFLHYLYTGCFDITSVDIKVAADVLSTARAFQVENLIAALDESLKLFVDLDTVFILFQSAFDNGAKGLLDFCREFMCDNAVQIVNSPLFATISVDAVVDIISNDFFAAPEMEILQAITYWHENNSDVDLTAVFERVRFELVSLDGWSLAQVAPVCKLLNAYKIDLHEAVNSSIAGVQEGVPKRNRFNLGE